MDLIKIKKLWDKYEKRILIEISKITGLKIDTDKTLCKIDTKTSNGYYGKNQIILGIGGGINEDDTLMVITHELFHIFYWKRIKKIGLTKSSPGSESKTEWSIAEVAAFLLTSSPTLKRYWPKASIYLYPEIKKTYKETEKFWDDKKIDNFAIGAYKLNK